MQNPLRVIGRHIRAENRKEQCSCCFARLRLKYLLLSLHVLLLVPPEYPLDAQVLDRRNHCNDPTKSDWMDYEMHYHKCVDKEEVPPEQMGSTELDSEAS